MSALRHHRPRHGASPSRARASRPTSWRSRARGVVAALLAVVTWGTVGRPRPATPATTSSPARASRTASCPTSTSSTTTGRWPRSPLGLVALVGGDGIGPRVALGLADRGRDRRRDLCASAYADGAARRLPRGGARRGRSPSRRPTSASSLPHTALRDARDPAHARSSCSAMNRFSARRTRAAGSCAAGTAAGARFADPARVRGRGARSGVPLWLGLARRTRRRRAAARSSLFAAPAVAIPAAGLRRFLPAVSPHRLLFENLYPRDFYYGAGEHACCARGSAHALELRAARREARPLRGGVGARSCSSGPSSGDRGCHAAAVVCVGGALLVALAAVAVARPGGAAPRAPVRLRLDPGRRGVAAALAPPRRETRRATPGAPRALRHGRAWLCARGARTVRRVLHPRDRPADGRLRAALRGRPPRTLHLVGLASAAARPARRRLARRSSPLPASA